MGFLVRAQQERAKPSEQEVIPENTGAIAVNA